jgi:alginate O-acetyltransferase complex protein AlgI
MSKSVAEFWRRWHMSLGSWFRDYVYIPLGGNRVGKGRWVFNTLVVWMLTGFWHGASWNFVLWGLLYAVFLMIEKWVPALKKLPDILRRVYTLLVVMFGFVIFNAVDLSQIGTDMAGLFGFGGLPAVTGQTLYYLQSFGLLFVLGIVGATPVVKKTATRISETTVGTVAEIVLLALLLLVCTAYLVDGSFSPFLYFRF